jgi:hypothetical protein
MWSSLNDTWPTNQIQHIALDGYERTTADVSDIPRAAATREVPPELPQASLGPPITAETSKRWRRQMMLDRIVAAATWPPALVQGAVYALLALALLWASAW